VARISRPPLGDARGQALPLVLVAVALAVVLTFGVASVARLVVEAGRARTAADAAALAGVDGGAPVAREIAAAHGAVLVAFAVDGGAEGRTVTVTVRYGRMTATAAASNRPP
jgi:Putative Flp pilus-assembly TadE/G-like